MSHYLFYRLNNYIVLQYLKSQRVLILALIRVCRCSSLMDLVIVINSLTIKREMRGKKIIIKCLNSIRKLTNKRKITETF